MAYLWEWLQPRCSFSQIAFAASGLKCLSQRKTSHQPDTACVGTEFPTTRWRGISCPCDVLAQQLFNFFVENPCDSHRRIAVILTAMRDNHLNQNDFQGKCAAVVKCG